MNLKEYYYSLNRTGKKDLTSKILKGIDWEQIRKELEQDEPKPKASSGYLEGLEYLGYNASPTFTISTNSSSAAIHDRLYTTGWHVMPPNHQQPQYEFVAQQRNFHDWWNHQQAADPVVEEVEDVIFDGTEKV